MQNLYGNLYPSGHMRLSIGLLKKLGYNFKEPVYAEFSLNKSKTKLIMKIKADKYGSNGRRSKIGIGFNGIVVCARDMWRAARMLSHFRYPVSKISAKTVVFDVSHKEKYKGINSYWRR